jgi:hypothetical protein
MALSFIKGEKVKNWVRGQMVAIDKKTMASGRDLDPSNETLWMKFMEDFDRAFTDTTQAQDALTKLKTLKMTGDDLDSYMATHESLVLHAGWDLNGDGAAESFRHGLKDGLHISIIKNHTPIPRTLEEWKQAAIVEHSRYTLMKASGLVRGQQSNQQKWKQWGERANQKNNRTKDPNAMDVDTTQLNSLTKEERDTLMKAGKCFKCFQPKHVSRNCP